MRNFDTIFYLYVMKTSTCFNGSYSLIVSYSRTEELMIAYFTLLVGEHCSHMMINRTLDHKHPNVLMVSSLLIVNASYPNVALGFPHFS